VQIVVGWLRSFVWLWLSTKETPKNDQKKTKNKKQKKPKATKSDV